LRDHFKTALSQTKPEAEELLLNGINHVFLHGSTYSPERAAWPGWKFYASVNFNPNNTIWEDAPALFSYIAYCQSMLQAGQPDNETLLYWPIYDVWDDYLDGTLFFQFKIHSLDEWLHGTHFYKTAKKLLTKGYGVDFISDNFIEAAKVVEGNIILPGGSYKSLVIPDSEKMPLKTLEKLLDLQKEGAHIIFEGLPESVPGFYRYKEQNLDLAKIIEAHKNETKIGDPLTLLDALQIYPEALVQTGLKFIRRDIDGEKIYYLVNHTANTVNAFVPLQVKTHGVVLYDPLTKKYGKASIEKKGSITKVKVNIPPGKSLFLKTGKVSDIPLWNYYDVAGNAIKIEGDWKLEFLKGGPKLPENATLSTLRSWTELNQEAESFSGTARYEIVFQKPDIEADNWILELGDVRESAKVWLNDNYLGDAWSVPFTLHTGALQNTNTLVVQVTNLAANRIRAKELRGEEWKIFHEINMVDKDYKEFDATKWKPMPSGILGDVTLTPLKVSNSN
ncbi:MAG TPA: glycosyl hydrolase, partial [Pricia sp.]|nr:glycosyl hydrolase [Pricia sp.]